MTLFNRFKKAWNAFKSRDQTEQYLSQMDDTYTIVPRNTFRHSYNDKSLIISIYNRITADAAAMTMRHVSLDADGSYVGTIDSSWNKIFNGLANEDQTGRELMAEAVYNLLEDGHIAIVPIDTDGDPFTGDYYNVYSMRVASIAQWRTHSVLVSAYNEQTGQRERLLYPKRCVAIIENPFYNVMNSGNSTLQRLKNKLNLLDVIDEKTASKKLDLIIQMPYMVKSEYQKKQAERRVTDIEKQLGMSQYGIAYTDGTERITQLNRPVENNLLPQVEYLTKMLYSQLSITQEIMNGTAPENVMINYYTRTINPIMTAIAEGMMYKFLLPTAINDGEAFRYFRDPFNSLTMQTLSSVVSVLKQYEILTSNEVRGMLGLQPSEEENANKLSNPNINPSYDEINLESNPETNYGFDADSQNE